MIKTVRSFLKSIDFFKSATLLFSILVPLALLGGLGKLSLAMSLVTGVLLCSPSDVPGSIRHMVVGILAGSTLAILNTLAIQLSLKSVWTLVPVMSGLVFFNAMLSVYGFRGSLVSFSGLLAIMLAFAHPATGYELLVHLALILVGGVWYLVVTMLAHTLVYRRQNQLILAECMDLTARYLRIRSRLIPHPPQANQLQKELFRLQTDINEKHEKLREIFVEERTRSGTSHSANKYLLIFIELVEMLELALSNPANYQQIETLWAGQEKMLKPLTDVLEATADRLEALAAVVSGDQPLTTQAMPSPEEAYERIRRHFNDYSSSSSYEHTLVLRNLLDYEHKQQQKIASIERVLRNVVDQKKIIQQSREMQQFMTHQDYDPGVIKQNLTWHSPIFRHAIRLTVTVLAGYALGAVLPVQNSYWIMLTIIVIMRPGYGLTKSRSIQRVVGTLIGGGIALGVVLLTQNPYVYGVLAALSVLFAFSLIQKNYAGGAAFITLYVIFLYALLQPDALSVVQFRVLDTVLGAGLSFLAGLFLWPSWEFMNIRSVIADSISTNRRYLQEISAFYQDKGALPTSYKLARKGAFLAIGDLSAAFQRMSQEPKSKQPFFSELYEMVVLNHTLLSAAAAMGTFIQHHRTSEKSPHFQAFIDSTDGNLERAQACLNREKPVTGHPLPDLTQAISYLDRQRKKVVEHHQESLPELLLEPEEKHPSWQEVSLMTGQLQWLHSLSENIRKAAQEMMSREE